MSKPEYDALVYILQSLMDKCCSERMWQKLIIMNSAHMSSTFGKAISTILLYAAHENGTYYGTSDLLVLVTRSTGYDFSQDVTCDGD